MPQLVADAELAVTELVTNALLHAGPPVSVVVDAAESLRIAVHDPSSTPPIRAPASSEAMTGRGLTLVSALCDRWGVERTDRGKAVWCEMDVRSARHPVRGETEAVPAEEMDQVLSVWDDLIPPAREPTYLIALADVPTALLLAAKAHIDNVVRELTLVRSGSAGDGTSEVPAHLATMVENVVTGFAAARNAIKRQALEASGRGEKRVRLTLTLPLSAADAGERYLAGLDDADAYARAARLLTLEAPPQHRVFRHWYVESLITQLRRRAAGLPVDPPPTFEECLLGEVDAIARAHRASDRAARLQHIAAALATPVSSADVAEVVVTAAVAALSARTGALLLAEDGVVTGVAGQVGHPTELLDRIMTVDPDRPLPVQVAAASGEAVWIESREERDARFPALAEAEPNAVSLCAVPLTVAGRLRGVLRFSFAELRLFDTGEREFMLALAAQTAQALERAHLYRSQARIADRLAHLQQVTAALAATRGVGDVTQVVIDHATTVLGAEVGAVCLLTEDGEELEMAAYRAATPDLVAGLVRIPVSADLPAAQAVRTGRTVVPDAGDRAGHPAPAATPAGVPAQERHRLVSLPLAVDDQPLGVLNLSLPGDRRVDDDELEFLTALADVCAQALDRARVLGAAQAAHVKLAFLADASAELASSLDYHRTLTRVARLAVPGLGDWCAVHVVEDPAPGAAVDQASVAAGIVDGRRVVPLAVAHVDPEQVALARRLQRRYPVPTGVANVIRTGKSDLCPVVTEEMPSRSAADPESIELMRALGISSLLTVPLATHDQVFGTITMARSHHGRAYTHEDLALAEDLARRAALAIDNANLYHENLLRRRGETDRHPPDQRVLP